MAFKNIQNKTSFQQSTKKKYTDEYFIGQVSFQTGKELFSESVLENSLSSERKKQKLIAALEFLDKAIEKGYEEAEAFSFRGMCLRYLNFDTDDLDDFNKCIELNSTNASYYYDRAMTKQYTYDFEGSIEDFKKAIELSKLENDDTRYWNEYSKQTGYDSGTQKYDHDLQFVLRDKEITSERLRQDVYDIRLLSRRNK